MILEIQKPRVTQIQVWMHCNGCVQKIKKALNGGNGIYDLYIDLPQQKISIIGWADLEKIVKAIKKTRKIATICSHTEPTESSPQPAESPSQSEDPAPKENAPAHHTTQKPAETQPAHAEPLKDTAPPEEPPSTEPTENNECQREESTPRTNNAREVHVIYDHPPCHGNRYGFGHRCVGHQERYHNSPVFLRETPAPIYVTQSYNTYNPSPHFTECVCQITTKAHTLWF